MVKKRQQPRAPRMLSAGEIRQLASVIQSRATYAARAGLTFGGKRDLYTALGYPRNLLFQDYRDRYDRGDIAARIVDAYPVATWRGAADLVEDENPDTMTKFEKAWEALNERLQIWSVFKRVDILAGIGRYAVILFGVPGEFSQPMPDRVSEKQLLYLTPFCEDDAQINTWDTDPTSPRYGQPLTYRLKRVSLTKGTDLTVHWSRLLHVADGTLDDLVYGAPRLRKVWNRLDDLDKVAGGGAEAFWKRVHQGLQMNLDKDVTLSPEGKKEMQEQADEFEHGMRRIFRTRGMDINPLGSDVADFKNPIAAIVSLISGATGIPQRILLGSERGELASSQDADNWDDQVSDRRREWAEPHLVKPFVQRLIDHGTLPTPKIYNVRWPEIDDLDEKERAEVALLWAELNQKAGETVVTGNEIRDRILLLDPLEPEDEPDEDDTTVIETEPVEDDADAEPATE